MEFRKRITKLMLVSTCLSTQSAEHFKEQQSERACKTFESMASKDPIKHRPTRTNYIHQHFFMSLFCDTLFPHFVFHSVSIFIDCCKFLHTVNVFIVWISKISNVKYHAAILQKQQQQTHKLERSKKKIYSNTSFCCKAKVS